MQALQVVEQLTTGFYRAVEELNLKITPKEAGDFVAKLADDWNKTGDLPSDAAIKAILQLYFWIRTTAA